MMQAVEHTAESAAHDMFLGSQALIWADEQGIITEQEFDAAELAYDTCQNKVYAVMGSKVRATGGAPRG